MRVAYVLNQYPRTSHSFIRREIRALEERGTVVLRFSLRPVDVELPTEADQEEARRTRAVLDEGPFRHLIAVLRRVLSHPTTFARALALALRMGWRSHRGLIRHLAYLSEACVLEQWLRAANVQHVHAHFGTNAPAVAALCRELGGPTFSFTVHGPEEFDHPEGLALREKMHRAAFVVAISSYGRAQLWRWSRFEDWSKVHVVRCGLERELIAAVSRPVPDVPRLLCVARLAEQKGHLVLIEAAARLVQEGTAFEIVLAGDGPLRGAIEDLIRRRDLRHCIRLTGWMSAAQVREAILSSRTVVLPSFAEGLPVVLMEALALKRPVIATAVAGVPELVQPGVNGWLVPAGSIDALVPALRDALHAPTNQLDAMGHAGAAMIAERHDASREAAKLDALFGSVVDQAPRTRAHDRSKRASTA